MKLSHHNDTMAITEVGGVPRQYKKYFTAKDYTPWLKHLGYREEDLGETPPCVYGKPIIEYFNRKDVRTALHIPETVQ